jgi:hypothetical protein
MRQVISITAGVVYTASVYAKANGYNLLYLNAAFSFAAYATFNLSTGAISAVGSGSAAIVSVGNGWYRCSVTGTAVSTQTAGPYFQVNNTQTGATDDTYVGDGTSGLFLWGAQLEVGAFPTSYIGPTTTTAITRTADVASVTGTNFSSWYRQDEGSAYIDFSLPTITGNTAIFSFSQAAAATTNRHSIRQGNTIITAAGSTVANFTNQTTAVNARSRIGYGYKVDDFFQVLNGTTSAADTSGAVPSNIDLLDIGKVEGAAIYSNAPIRRLTYWPTRLSNSTLQSITQ